MFTPYSVDGQRAINSISRGALNHTLLDAALDAEARIADEQRDALCQPFRRGAAGHGSGLGLAIARGFAEANGGRLWAQDDPAGGHLVLSLPLAERRAVVPA